MHRNSGIPDNFADSEKDALAQVRRFLSFLPPSVHEPPPRLRTNQPEDSTPDVAERLRHAIPMGRKESYDIRAVIRMLVDEDPASVGAGDGHTGFFEIGNSRLYMVLLRTLYIFKTDTSQILLRWVKKPLIFG